MFFCTHHNHTKQLHLLVTAHSSCSYCKQLHLFILHKNKYHANVNIRSLNNKPKEKPMQSSQTQSTFLKDKEILYRGSSKDIYLNPKDKHSIFMHFLDETSVFDVGRMPKTYKGKGSDILAAALASYELARRLGIPTNFIEQVAPNVIRVYRVNVIREKIPKGSINFLIPAEWIFRKLVLGSLYEKFTTSKADPLDFGLPRGVPKLGTPLPRMATMMTTKLEKIDRDIDEQELLDLSGIDEGIVREGWEMITNIVSAETEYMERAGFAQGDGKFELAMNKKRELMIVDTFGTQDEDRPILLSSLKKGKIEHYSKEFVRELYTQNGYKAKLKKARKNKQPDPSMPSLTDDELRKWSYRYKLFGSAYHAAVFNA